MGRILYSFERKGVRNIILGTFGTGVFGNIATVAGIWTHLSSVTGSKTLSTALFFAITGDETFTDFRSAFNAWGQPRATTTGLGRSSNRSCDMLASGHPAGQAPKTVGLARNGSRPRLGYLGY